MIRIYAIAALLCLLAASGGAGIRNVPLEYNSIQAGIDAAADGDTVLVAEGTWREFINFRGRDITVAGRYIVSGDESSIGRTVIDAFGAGRPVTFQSSESRDARLSGFTITGGGVADGSGIYLRGADPTLDHLIVRDNRASGDGAGIACIDNSDPMISDCVISGNQADAQGGGIYCRDGSSPVMTNVEISGNSASSGGGIYLNNQCHASLTDVDVLNNTAASLGGGMVIQRFSNATLTRVVIYGNHAGPLNGGGVYVGISDPIFENVTIAADSSADEGGGLYMLGSIRPVFHNTILWGNYPSQAHHSGNPDPPAVLTVSYCDVQDGQLGFIRGGNASLRWEEGNISEDPRFVNLLAGNLNLRVNSPCINAGDPDSPDDPDGSRADIGARYLDIREVGERGEPFVPTELEIIAAYPNPFNAGFTVDYRSRAGGWVGWQLTDLLGRGMLSGDQIAIAGLNHLNLQSIDIPTGEYVILMQSGMLLSSKRVTCIK